MTDQTSGDVDPLQAVLALTPAGRQELREPHSGLSLPQRWLLAHLDGHSRLADLVGKPGSPTAERLPRDAAKLVRLGLVNAVGGAGLAASAFGPSTLHGDLTLALPLDDAGLVRPAPPPAAPPAPPRSKVPRLVAGGALLVGAAAVYWVAAAGDRRPSAGMASRAPEATAAAPAASPAATATVAAADPTPAGPTVELTASVPASDSAAAPPRPPLAALAVARPRSAPETSAATTAAAAPAPPLVPAPGPSVPPLPGAQPPAPVPTPVPTPSPASLPAPPVIVAPPAAAGVAASAPTPSAGPAATTVAPSPQPAATTIQAAVVTTGPALRPVSTVEPSFPRDGLGLGTRAVTLQARLVVDASGAVTQVNFEQRSASTRPFERSARTALLQWRFPAGAPDRVYTQQVRFSEE